MASRTQALTRVIRQVRQPCLGFKVLGAGRLCANQSMVCDASRFAFENIKPTDGVIVGMYPRFFDEVNADAQYARQWRSTYTAAGWKGRCPLTERTAAGQFKMAVP